MFYNKKSKNEFKDYFGAGIGLGATSVAIGEISKLSPTASSVSTVLNPMARMYGVAGTAMIGNFVIRTYQEGQKNLRKMQRRQKRVKLKIRRKINPQNQKPRGYPY